MNISHTLYAKTFLIDRKFQNVFNDSRNRRENRIKILAETLRYNHNCKLYHRKYTRNDNFLLKNVALNTDCVSIVYEEINPIRFFGTQANFKLKNILFLTKQRILI